MLFELSDELINYPIEKEIDVIDCITNVLIGYYEGNHLLMSSESFCEKFKNKIVEDRAKRALFYLEKHLSYSYDVNWRVKVVLNDADPKKHEINLDFFNKTSAIQPTRVIGEHLNDAYFYYYIMCSMIDINDIVENTSYIPDLGGGSSSIDKIEQLFNNSDSINLGIFDSDKKHPSDNNKDRMSEKISKRFRNKKMNVGIEIINVLEVENLIPLSFILELHKDKKTILNIIKIRCPELLNYYDFKEGIYYNCNADDQKYNEKIKDWYNKTYKGKESFDEFIKKGKSKGEPICIFPNIGKSILKSFVEQSNVKYPKRIKLGLFDNENRLINEWNRIAKIMYTYTCSRKKDPINPL
ncbi:MAG: hypothetical protein SPK72_07085 [Bacteroidales bacterium]|nr:hypothetical protein [Bacteroidales bacterium]